MKRTESFLNRLEERIGLLMEVITGGSRWLNESYAKIYFDEVTQDINMLKRMMQEPKFERNSSEEFQKLVKKYDKDYCPFNLSKYFSFNNQIQYLALRAKIDEILSRKDQTHSDFEQSDFG